MDIRYLGASKRYSEAVVANGLVSLRVVPENPEADAKAQTENVLAQIDSWLAQCQSDKAHILEATIYLPDMNDYAAMNEAWDAWTAPERAPARACVEAKLASPDWKVEIKISRPSNQIKHNPQARLKTQLQPSKRSFSDGLYSFAVQYRP